jgi:hypothetical protein
MMKKKNLYLLGIALFSTLFGSCEWEVNLDDLKPAPRLVLNSVVRTDEPVTANVSRTWFFTEENPNVSIPDAEVSLYVNGQYKETLAWMEGDREKNTQGHYQAAYTPKAGERIMLTAAREGYATVSGEAVIPASDLTFKVEERITELFNTSGDDTDFNGKRMLSVTFRDNPDEKNYYIFLCKIEDPIWRYYDNIIEFLGYEWIPLDAEYEEEPLFMGQKNALEEILEYGGISGIYGRVFTDEQINGKEYTLRIPSQNSALYLNHIYGDEYVENSFGYLVREIIDTEPTPIRHYRVSLYSITESYYRYMKTLIEKNDSSLQGDLAEMGLAEPIGVHSNIKNGLGILGACSGQSVTLELSTKKE